MKILWFLLLVVIFEGAFYDGIEFIKLGSDAAGLTINDVVVTCVYLVWFILIFFGRLRLPSLFKSMSLYVFILALLVPILVGFSEEHLWRTVLRDARAPYYFILSFVVASYVNDEEALRRIVKPLIIVGVLFLIWGYLVYIFKIPVATSLKVTYLKTGKTTRFFGYHSSQMLFMVVPLFLINYLFVFRDRIGRKYKAAVLGFCFVIGLLLTLVRGLFIGLLAGAVVSVLIQKSKIKLPVIILGLFFSIISSALVIGSSDIKTQLLSISVVERYWSIVDPSVTTRLGKNSGVGRIKAIEMVNRIVSENPMLGVGYGENKKYTHSQFADPVLGMISHSGPSWMMYRTGYIGTIILSLCLFMFLLRGMKMFKNAKEGGFARFAYGGATASLVGIYASTLGANMLFNADRFTIHIAIIIGIVFSNFQESEKTEVRLA